MNPLLAERVDRVVNYMRTTMYPARKVLLADAKWLGENARAMKTEVFQLRNLCLASEIYDLCGDYVAARRVVELAAEKTMEQLAQARKAAQDKPWRKRDVEEMRLLRQRLWVVLFYANALYRLTKDMKAVLQHFKDCERTIDLCLPLEHEAEHNEPSYGLRSRIAYSQGVVHLRLEDILTARQCFSRAMDLQQQRFDAKLKKMASMTDREEHLKAIARERAYARYTAAKIFGLGLGWCSLRAGELTRARASIACARTMFEFSNDDVHRAFMELLYATTLRMQSPLGGGRDLDKAIGLLRNISPQDGPFEHHPKYRAHALYELAYALIDRQIDNAEVDGLLAEVESLSGKDDVLSGNAQLLVSRKQRLLKQNVKALQTAEKVESRFAKSEKVIVRALVATAEAKIDLGRYADADEDLQKAMLKARGNPLWMGLCHLHRVQCYLSMGQWGNARHQLAKWRVLKPHIEDASALQLSDELEARLLEDKGLWLSREEALNRTLDEITDQITRRTLELYAAEYGSDWVQKAVDQLGKSPARIYQLAGDLGIPRPSDLGPKRPK